jgi:hypothetical protein
MGVELHIEELVLHGFAARDRHRIAAAVQVELARLLAAEGQANLLKGRWSLETVNAGAFKVQANAKPLAAGKQIAQAVYRTISREAKIATLASRSHDGPGGRKI